MVETVMDTNERPLAWARVYPALHRSLSKWLRRGTWYEVVRNDLPDRISLKVGERTVDVPRRVVEIRDGLPKHFSVVTRTDVSPADGNRTSQLGRRYMVCPHCGTRTRLTGEPRVRDCPGCGRPGEVGWWES